MKEEDIRRLGGILGLLIFVISLLILLLKTGPASALLFALAAGVGCGFAVYATVLLTTMARTSAPSAAAMPPAEGTEGVSDETRKFGPGEMGSGLDQTVRLAPGTLEYVLPEISPEEVLKEREGIDMDFLQQGIEGVAKARENMLGKTESPEGGQ